MWWEMGPSIFQPPEEVSVWAEKEQVGEQCAAEGGRIRVTLHLRVDNTSTPCKEETMWRLKGLNIRFSVGEGMKRSQGDANNYLD